MAQKSFYKNICSLVDESLKSTINNSNDYLLDKYYRLGKGYCKTEQFHNSMILSMVNFNNSCLLNYMSDILKEGPDNCFKPNIPDNLGQRNQKAIHCPVEESSNQQEIIPDPPQLEETFTPVFRFLEGFPTANGTEGQLMAPSFVLMSVQILASTGQVLPVSNIGNSSLQSNIEVPISTSFIIDFSSNPAIFISTGLNIVSYQNFTNNVVDIYVSFFS